MSLSLPTRHDERSENDETVTLSRNQSKLRDLLISLMDRAVERGGQRDGIIIISRAVAVVARPRSRDGTRTTVRRPVSSSPCPVALTLTALQNLHKPALFSSSCLGCLVFGRNPAPNNLLSLLSWLFWRLIIHTRVMPIDISFLLCRLSQVHSGLFLGKHSLSSPVVSALVTVIFGMPLQHTLNHNGQQLSRFFFFFFFSYWPRVSRHRSYLLINR